MLNEAMNGFMQGTLLCSDPPAHDVKRKVIMEPLTPTALRAIRSEITAEAEALTDELCGRREFNAAVDLAEPLPLAIVAKRVGLPPVKREGQLRWTKASFDCIGPGDRERTQAALRILPEIGGFVGSNAAREQIDPDSWLGGLYRAADAGLIAHAECGPMSIDYVGPSLDTTIGALSSAVWLFATHPTQWKSVRENPALIPNAINEIVRLETPIQGWTRYVTESVELGGVQLPPGSRVLVMFGSANRDERKWNDPERFDVNRQVSDHMGFGHGEHACAGANLARLEIMAMLNALAAKVERFELVGEAVREVTQATRGWANIPVRVHLA
jgi:cytochrome P450